MKKEYTIYLLNDNVIFAVASVEELKALSDYDITILCETLLRIGKCAKPFLMVLHMYLQHHSDNLRFMTAFS